jgi:hypothetical protein
MSRNHNDNQRNTIRNQPQEVSFYPELNDAFLQYNGAAEEYEDPADYLPRGMSVKAVRLG